MAEIVGAARGIRTPDPLITNEVLYQLSYCGTLGFHALGSVVGLTDRAVMASETAARQRFSAAVAGMGFPVA